MPGRGNRQLNWVIHTIAVTQLRHDAAGRRFHDRRVAEGKTTEEALREDDARHTRVFDDQVAWLVTHTSKRDGPNASNQRLKWGR